MVIISSGGREFLGDIPVLVTSIFFLMFQYSPLLLNEALALSADSA